MTDDIHYSMYDQENWTVRLSSETSFDSKQSKLEPKLVSALSETKSLFRMFHFYIETVSFSVSKQTTVQPKQMKQTKD